MTWIAARYHDGRTSRGLEVQLSIGADGYVRVTGEGIERTERLADVDVSPRLGRTSRIVAFSDGASCETDDNDAVDAALAELQSQQFTRGLHLLESRWSYALIAIIVLAVGTWAGIQFGIPALARHAAFALPVETDRVLGSQALDALDRTLFEPSKLPDARQEELQALFARMSTQVHSGHELKLELRQSDIVGANAFALPSGIVVMTDGLVELAENDAEIEAVLAHEIGHVVSRHSLRMLLQNSATSLLMIAVLGDVSTASALVATLPTVLVQMKHSRQFEREADDYAYQWLDRRGLPRHHFGDMLARLEKAAGANDDSMSWLSSHPRAVERLRN